MDVTNMDDPLALVHLDPSFFACGFKGQPTPPLRYDTPPQN